jgi:hypothetical protein
MVEMSRFLLLALICAPLALCQSAASSDGLVDKILGIAGPAKPSPLTEQRRFHLYVLNTIGPAPLLGEAAAAGIQHWRNLPAEYGQGWGAFGKRYGSNLAYNATRQTITYAVAAAFREDTRYFGSTSEGVLRRTAHALVSTFTARRPDGAQTFSVSSVTGVVGACAISSIWGPRDWKGARNIAYNAAVSFAATAGFNIAREFLPDILRRPRK